MNKFLLIIFTCIVSKLLAQRVDTIAVNQIDTLIFSANVSWIQQPCSKPEWNTIYEMKKPKDSTYYLIYNDKGQLTEEGLYTSEYVIDGEMYSGFYNSKFYYYKNSRKLSRIYYQIDGRNSKMEYYRRGKLKETKIIN